MRAKKIQNKINVEIKLGIVLRLTFINKGYPNVQYGRIDDHEKTKVIIVDCLYAPCM